MAAAAGQALARGDLRDAALAYLDAAWIAQEQKNPRQVWELGHRAEMLADSPLLGAVRSRGDPAADRAGAGGGAAGDAAGAVSRPPYLASGWPARPGGPGSSGWTTGSSAARPRPRSSRR